MDKNPDDGEHTRDNKSSNCAEQLCSHMTIHHEITCEQTRTRCVTGVKSS